MTHSEPDCVCSNLVAAVAMDSCTRTDNTIYTTLDSNRIDCSNCCHRQACDRFWDERCPNCCFHWHLWRAIAASSRPCSAYHHCRSDSNRDVVDNDCSHCIPGDEHLHDFLYGNWNSGSDLDPNVGSMVVPKIFAALFVDGVDAHDADIYWWRCHCQRYFYGACDAALLWFQQNRSMVTTLAVNAHYDFYCRAPVDCDSAHDVDPSCPDASPIYQISANSFRWTHSYGHHYLPRLPATRRTNTADYLVRVVSLLRCIPMWSHRHSTSIHLRSIWGIYNRLYRPKKKKTKSDNVWMGFVLDTSAQLSELRNLWERICVYEIDCHRVRMKNV